MREGVDEQPVFRQQPKAPTEKNLSLDRHGKGVRRITTPRRGVY